MQAFLSGIESMKSNPALKFAPSGRWDAPAARPLAPRWAELSLSKSTSASGSSLAPDLPGYRRTI